jgi:hypothetical protein
MIRRSNARYGFFCGHSFAMRTEAVMAGQLAVFALAIQIARADDEA